MSDRVSIVDELVIANHILAHEGVVDAFGHISARDPGDPDRFLLSRSRSPELVCADDIMSFALDGRVAEENDERSPYLERFIHAGIYAARADVMSIVHSHSHEVLPFAVARKGLRPVTHLGAICGEDVPVWDIRDNFGEETDLLVANIEQGRDLAAFLDDRDGLLMRGHGSVVVASNIREATLKAIHLGVNASVLLQAQSVGEPVFLTLQEQRAAKAANLGENPVKRAWEYYCRRAGSVAAAD